MGTVVLFIGLMYKFLELQPIHVARVRMVAALNQGELDVAASRARRSAGRLGQPLLQQLRNQILQAAILEHRPQFHVAQQMVG